MPRPKAEKNETKAVLADYTSASAVLAEKVRQITDSAKILRGLNVKVPPSKGPLDPYGKWAGRDARIEFVTWDNAHGIMVTLKVYKLNGDGFLDSSDARLRSFIPLFSVFEALP